MTDVPEAARQAAEHLTDLGARFVLLVGSHARGEATTGSDVDVAAHFGGEGRARHLSALAVMPPGTDLVVLDTAPLELAGRAALEGVLLDRADPVTHVRWLATTRKIYLDERFRRERDREDFIAAFAGRP